jgi:phospholipid/cholesterol/gamma-HCH transport system substrate-binding protein
MNKSRLEWKVGLFALIALGLLGSLLILFSKGTTLFKPSYHLLLRAGNVGGLKAQSYVLMAGVQIGTVSGIKLGPQGTNVTVTLAIYKQFQVRTNAEFSIEASGILGDQYVAVTPKPAEADVPVFNDGDVAVANAPWTLIGVANRVLTSLGNFDEAAASLRRTIDDIHVGAFSSDTLSNFSATIANLKVASVGAVTTLSNIDALVIANGPAIYRSGTNLATATAHMDEVVGDIKILIATNRAGIDRSISNIENLTLELNGMIAKIQAGEGLVGELLNDPKMAARASEIVGDLSVTTSNLNKIGLWRVLFPKKGGNPSPKARPEGNLESPKNRSN